MDKEVLNIFLKFESESGLEMRYLISKWNLGWHVKNIEDVGMYLRYPLITFSRLSFILFKHPPHHHVLHDNMAQSKCIYCKA